MAQTTSDYLIGRLKAWGVRRIYGYPGDGINGLMGALARAGDGIEFIQVRHEEMAALMACAHAKFTGEPGVCMATSGPGAIHLLNGLYDAKMDHVPVVAITGQSATTAIGGDYQQEVDLVRLFSDVAREYVYSVCNPVQIRQVVDRAFRIAQSTRSVTCVIVPKDVQEMDAVPSPPHAHDTVHTGVGMTRSSVVPAGFELQRAADLLNRGERIAMLVGAGGLHATDEIIAVAERLGAGVAKALLGKAAVPDDLPFVTGQIGLLGTAPSSDMMDECDTLFMIGTAFPYAEFLPKEGRARCVQIDVDARNMSLRYPVDVDLAGDSKETLRALLPFLEHKDDRSWRDRIEKKVAHWWKTIEARALEPADPINPERVFTELSSRLPDNCILSGDAGTATNWYARYVKLRRGMMGSLSGGLATMGSAVPYAIAAKFAFPERTAIAVTGDGAMQMNGNAELITVAKYWKRWSNPHLIVLVLNNRDLAQVTWEMRAMAGNAKFEASQDLPNFPYAAYAESIGLQGIRVDDPDSIGDAWDEALDSDRPVVLEAITDPNVPTLPPHISLKEAKALMSSIRKGDVDMVEVLTQSARQLLAGFTSKRNGENSS